MIDKNLFIQDLKQVYTVLQELKVIENNTLKLIDIVNNLNSEEITEIKTYINSIKDFIIQNGNLTEIGGNVEIDGKLSVNSETTFNGTNTFNKDVTITGELYLPSSTSLIFEDGSTIGGGGSSKLYRHYIKIGCKEFPEHPDPPILIYLYIDTTSSTLIFQNKSSMDDLDSFFADGIPIAVAYTDEYDGRPINYIEFKTGSLLYYGQKFYLINGSSNTELNHLYIEITEEVKGI